MKQSHRKSQPAAALVLFAGITIASCGGGQDETAVVADANACTPADHPAVPR